MCPAHKKLDIGIDCECFEWAEKPQFVQRHGRTHVVALDRVLCFEIVACATCIRRGLDGCTVVPSEAATCGGSAR
eukprot:969589-Prymnesium_polylepis.1